MARKYRRFSPAQGATICIVGLLLGAVAWQLATALTQYGLLLQVLLLLFAWFSFWFFVHDLTHHIVGKVGGIRFQYYFLGRSAVRKLRLPLVSRVMERVPVLVLKVDRGSFAKASPRARRWMHASGALASMILPWIIVPSSFMIRPLWVGILFTLLVLGNVLFTLYFSPKTGDIYRARTMRG